MLLQHLQNIFTHRFFFVSSNLVSLVQDCRYESILLSNHAPVILSIQIPKFFSHQPSFRFQTQWLRSPEFVEFLDGKITDYFHFSTNQTSASIKWEAFKCYIRGEIISFTRTKSKLHRNKLQDIDKQIKELHNQL